MSKTLPETSAAFVPMDLAAAICQAALGPDAWPALLQQIADLLDADAGVLFMSMSRGGA
jgi:hypothetical protein